MRQIITALIAFGMAANTHAGLFGFGSGFDDEAADATSCWDADQYGSWMSKEPRYLDVFLDKGLISQSAYGFLLKGQFAEGMTPCEVSWAFERRLKPRAELSNGWSSYEVKMSNRVWWIFNFRDGLLHSWSKHDLN